MSTRLPYEPRKRIAVVDAPSKRVLATTIRGTEAFNRKVLAQKDRAAVQKARRSESTEDLVKAVSTGVKDNSRYDAEREYWRQRKVQAKVDKAARKEHIKANAKKLIRQYRRDQGLAAPSSSSDDSDDSSTDAEHSSSKEKKNKKKKRKKASNKKKSDHKKSSKKSHRKKRKVEKRKHKDKRKKHTKRPRRDKRSSSSAEESSFSSG